MSHRLAAPLALVLAGAVVAAAPASAASVAVGVWHLDEAAGAVTAVDSSGAGHNGTLRGSVVAGQPGYQGSAYEFTRGWVEVPTAADLNPGTADFSFSAYVKPTRDPATDETFDVLRKGTAGATGGEFKMEIASHGRVKCIAQGVVAGTRVTARVVAKEANLLDGQWHRVECSRTGTTWTVRRDGYSKSITLNFGSVVSSKSVAIGSKYGNDDFMQGLIDEAQLQITAP